MSIHNKWQALSMKDRAFLIREAVRNGITDIGSIRDTWEHRFDGESNQPTEDEYIAYKADSVRQAALNRARNRTTLELPIIGYEKASPEAIRSALEEVFIKEREIPIARQRAMVLGNYNDARSKYEQLIKDRDYWLEHYRDLQKYSTGQGRPLTGANCIYTVSGDFGRPVSGNFTFRDKHSELGFKEIPFKETIPGDIVQFRSFTGDPVHALMSNTSYSEDTNKMRYNGSSGGDSEDNLRINSRYPLGKDEPTPFTYRFVGNKADSLQWKKEYREKYGHKFNGLRDIVNKVNTSDKDFARRLRQEGRASIPDWEDPRSIATHKLSVATDENGIHYIYPEVQNVNGQLVDFTNPKTKGYNWGSVIAAERGDTIQVGKTRRDLENAIRFTEGYKDLGIFPEFSAPPHKYSGEEPKYITEDNYKEELSKFRNAFEEYHPEAYWDSIGEKWTVGTGLTYLIDDKGKEIPVRKGQRLSEEENQEQIRRRVSRDEDYARKKTPHWDNYHPELKFQILEAMYNAGNANVWEKSPKYQQALRRYEKAEGWKDKNYDLKDIFQHADWNLNDEKWLGIRSRMRRNPQAINPDDYSKIYLNHFRDSLRTVYDTKFKEK